MTRLEEKYKDQVLPAMMKEFRYSNFLAAPRVEKIVVNVGVGEAIQNVKLLDVAAAELAAITGQRPVVRRARKSIAGFKLRTGMPIGVKVTLRGDRMYEFLDRLLNIGLPRVRDFRGLSPRAFDGRGNYTIGLKDQLIFPEIDLGKAERLMGMNVTLVTSAKTDEEARFLLSALGMPFAKKEERRLVAF
ncbi:MAG: 50S ribosomal protein L5 [Acidobacteriota bacterium]